MFYQVMKQDPSAIDLSVYRTGLRMVGMHKGSITNLQPGEVSEHERLFGEDSYKHCYRFVDFETLEHIPMTVDIYKATSINVRDDSVPYTAFKDEDLNDLIKTRGGKGRPKKRVLPADVEAEKRMEEALRGKHEDFEPESQLCATLEWLFNHYGHAPDLKDVKKSHSCLIFPLSKVYDCHFVNRKHTSNHQFLVVDKNGSSQRCHNLQCKGENWKKIPPSKFSKAVKQELITVGILDRERQLNSAKPRDEALAIDKRDQIIQVMVTNVQDHINFPLKVNPTTFIETATGAEVDLTNTDTCPTCFAVHPIPLGTLFIDTRSAHCYFRCFLNKKKLLPEPFQLDPQAPNNIPTLSEKLQDSILILRERRRLFTCDFVQGLQYYLGLDIPINFEQAPIFDDEQLNQLMYEGLSDHTSALAKILHYLLKHQFACTVDGVWYQYTYHRWKQNSEDAFITHIEIIVAQFRNMKIHYSETKSDEKLAEKQTVHIDKIIQKLSNFNARLEILKDCKVRFTQNDPFCTDGIHNFQDMLDEKRHLLNFTTGIYDLDTDEFRPGRPDDFLTLSCGCEYTTNSDPEKRAFLNKFFEDIQPDREEREYLPLFLSSNIHGSTKEEVFHIMTGGAANGKSVLRDAMASALGEYFETIPANLLCKERPGASSPTPEIVKLKGKRAAWGSEPEENQSINTGFVKWIVGNDPMTGRLLNSNHILTFFPQFKLVLLTKDIPLFDSNDNGTFRRARIQVFPTTFMDDPGDSKYEKQIDETLKERIKGCQQEFMLMLIEKYRVYRSMPRLRPTKRINDMVEAHRLKNNPVLHFLESCSVTAHGYAISVKSLCDHFSIWCRSQKVQCPGKSAFKEELQRIKTIEYVDKLHFQGTKGYQPGVKNRKFLAIDSDMEATGGNTDEQEESFQDGGPSYDLLMDHTD